MLVFEKSMVFVKSQFGNVFVYNTLYYNYPKLNKKLKLNKYIVLCFKKWPLVCGLP